MRVTYKNRLLLNRKKELDTDGKIKLFKLLRVFSCAVLQRVKVRSDVNAHRRS